MAVTGTQSQHASETVSVSNLVVGGAEIPASYTIALAAGAANVMTITVTAKDRNGATLARVHDFTLYMSEASTGLGLTADSYSGDLVASTGVILGALTAKKAWRVQTGAAGTFVAGLTDTSTPADQYVVVSHPMTGALTVSAASSTNWGA